MAIELDPTTEPHCGVCRHANWEDLDRTPFCSKWEQSTAIRLGSVCVEFDEGDAVADPFDLDAEDRLDRPSEAEPRSEDREIGTDGPFFAAYFEDGENLYGWFCANCGTLDTAMDSMGRLECNRCGNTCSPSEWDAAYL